MGMTDKYLHTNHQQETIMHDIVKVIYLSLFKSDETRDSG